LAFSITVNCAALPDAPNAGAQAREAVRAFHAGLGL